MPIGRQVLTQDPRTAAGQRDKAVLVEQATSGVDSTGFPAPTWAPLRTVMMSRLDLRADERYDAAQESAYVETQWEMPYAADMDPEVVDVPRDRRLNYRGRIYNIRVAVMIGQRRGIQLMTLAEAGTR